MHRTGPRAIALLAVSSTLTLSCDTFDRFFVQESIAETCAWVTWCDVIGPRPDDGSNQSNFEAITFACEERYEEQRRYFRKIGCLEEFDEWMTCVASELVDDEEIRCSNDADLCYWRDDRNSTYDDLEWCEQTYLDNSFGTVRSE